MLNIIIGNAVIAALLYIIYKIRYDNKDKRQRH